MQSNSKKMMMQLIIPQLLLIVIKMNFVINATPLTLLFSDDGHHVHIYSKYNINEPNNLNTKDKHFGILFWNIASSIKHIDSLNTFLDALDFKFAVIDLSEHKTGARQLIILIYPVIIFCTDKTKSFHHGLRFFYLQ